VRSPLAERDRDRLIEAMLPDVAFDGWSHVALGARLVYDTVDGIWYAAGDTATDFSFYTKRATLAGIYGATLLFWLEDRSEGGADTAAFIDRRLAEIARLGEARHRLHAALERLPNPLRLLRSAR
jgi:ubiquinone biosynthesis protein COQ9